MTTLPDITQPKRAFWSKTEGKWGMGIILLAIAAAVIGLNTIGPAILGALGVAIALTSKSLVLAALAGLGWVTWMVVSNEQVQNLVSFFFKSGVRKLTGIMVEIDPIGIMRNFISSLRDRRETMAKNISALSGQVTTVEQKIIDNQRLADKALAEAAQAKKTGNSMLMTVSSKQNGRLLEYTARLEGIVAKMKVLLQLLRKYYDASGAVIADLNNEVNIQEDQRKMMFSAYSAMTAAKEIIMGEGNRRELFDMAMDNVKDSYGQKLGEIEDFMTMSQSFIDGVDLQNGVFEEEALKKIAAWESKVDSLLIGNDKRQILETAGTSSIPIFNANTMNQGSSDYATLFGRK
jgi:hypothetical protein